MPIAYKGSAKPDDPIYRMGLVVSGRTTKPSSKDSAPKPEVALVVITKEQAIEIATQERRRVPEDDAPQSRSTVRPLSHASAETALPEECLTAIYASDQRPAGAYLRWHEEPAWYISFRSQHSVEMERSGMGLVGTVPNDIIAVSKSTGGILGLTWGPIGD